MGNFRGLKRDVWEGGHRVPFIVKWPGHVKKNTISNEVISQIDIMATLASITGIQMPKNAAPDSYDITPVIKKMKYKSPLREATIQKTFSSTWGKRIGV
jgi:arylsulfatase A-like enzyme